MAFLGQASIIINQATLVPGVTGISRDDGVLGEVVTLRNADDTSIGLAGHRWVLQRPRGSTAVLTAPTSPTTQFTPDVVGTYRISLRVNGGLASTQRQVLVFGVRTAGGLRYPAQEEGGEANWTSTDTGQPNETGYWEDLDRNLRTATAAGQPGVILLEDVDGEAENLLAARANDPPVRDETKRGQVSLGSSPDPGHGTGGDFATVSGGADCDAIGDYATVGGGRENTAGQQYAVVMGGFDNTAGGDYSIAGGGSSNSANDDYTAVCGGYNNIVDGALSFIGGGQGNHTDSTNCVIGGGYSNQATSGAAVVGGGETNIASGAYSGVVCGLSNAASGEKSFVGGGSSNEASGLHSCIPGGSDNAAGGDYATAIGANCQATGDYSLAGGRTALALSDYAIALGRSPSAQHAGAVVIKDGDVSTVQSSAANQLTLSFLGGARIFTAGARIRVSGFDSASNYREIAQGDVVTTDGTPAAAQLVSIPDGQSVFVRGIIMGKRSGTDAVRVHRFEGTYYNIGGTVSLLSGALAVSAAQSDGLGAAYSTSLAINGTAVDVNFTGTNAHTVRWTWDFEICMGGAA